MNYTAHFEYLSAKLATVELTDSSGQWAGSYRVEAGTSRKGLRELGYEVANREASLKGGRLDRFVALSFCLLRPGQTVTHGLRPADLKAARELAAAAPAPVLEAPAKPSKPRIVAYLVEVPAKSL